MRGRRGGGIEIYDFIQSPLHDQKKNLTIGYTQMNIPKELVHIILEYVEPEELSQYEIIIYCLNKNYHFYSIICHYHPEYLHEFDSVPLV